MDHCSCSLGRVVSGRASIHGVSACFVPSTLCGFSQASQHHHAVANTRYILKLRKLRLRERKSLAYSHGEPGCWWCLAPVLHSAAPGGVKLERRPSFHLFSPQPLVWGSLQRVSVISHIVLSRAWGCLSNQFLFPFGLQRKTEPQVQ